MTIGFAKLTRSLKNFRICVPNDYMKFELPEEGEPTIVSIGKLYFDSITFSRMTLSITTLSIVTLSIKEL